MALPASRALCAAAIAASMLSSCQSMAPRYERPPLPVAAEYPSDATAGTPAAALNDPGIGWRDYFSDPDLRALVEQALQNNRDLRAAILRVAEARARYGIQRADRYPDVSLGAAASRNRTPGDLSVTGRPLTASSYEVSLGLSTWELDFWGRVRSLELAALESYLAVDAARRAFRVSLVAEVANAWLLLRELDQRIDLARKSIASRQETFRIFSRRYQVGSSSRLELMQVESLLTQAQALGTELEQQRAATGHALGLLVGARSSSNRGPGCSTATAGSIPCSRGCLRISSSTARTSSRPSIV
jgi:multidrug efflux system outer membrane protein